MSTIATGEIDLTYHIGDTDDARGRRLSLTTTAQDGIQCQKLWRSYNDGLLELLRGMHGGEFPELEGNRTSANFELINMNSPTNWRVTTSGQDYDVRLWCNLPSSNSLGISAATHVEIRHADMNLRHDNELIRKVSDYFNSHRQVDGL